MSDTQTIENAPIGSNEFQINPTFGPETLATIELDGLANQQETVRFAYNNKSQQPFCTVKIVLNPISPIFPASIQIVNDSTGYEVGLDCSYMGARSVEFVDIPSVFLSNFRIKNKTGVPLAINGNYVIVAPKY